MERTSLLAYSILAVVIALLIYPVYGHWVWGNFLNPDNGAWLAELGFHDFAGGSVVHLLGATIAFVGLKVIGPRIGRFGPNGEVNELAPSNIGLTMLGVLILWFGWWGFNGGSHLAFNGDVTATIVNTNLAGVAGLAGAGMWAYLMQERYAMNTKLVGGAIGGLIAITSSADIISPFASLAIGLVAGVIYSIAHDFLLSIKIDDALGVVPAHGFCAIWGLLSLALFATDDTFEHGRFRAARHPGTRHRRVHRLGRRHLVDHVHDHPALRRPPCRTAGGAQRYDPRRCRRHRPTAPPAGSHRRAQGARRSRGRTERVHR